MRLTVLGMRGSVPVEGANFTWGGATSCFCVRTATEEIYLDAGSGIVKSRPSADTRLTVLLTHLHLDHVLGLPFFPGLYDRGRHIDIYAFPHSGFTPEAALDRLISPPFWPCGIHDYPARVAIHDLAVSATPDKLQLGDVKIDMREGFHPGGATMYRLTCGGKSLVYATDFEHSPTACAALAEFAAGCDLLLYDAQYTETEYEKYKGYGHSTAAEGVKVARRAAAKKLLLVHHAPNRTDEELEQMTTAVRGAEPDVVVARAGAQFWV